MKKQLLVPACLLALAVTAAAASARPEARAADPGVTANTVTIGGTVPLSGVAAAYASVAKGAEAYFKYVNANGGVNGRRIQYTYLDDAYNEANTVQQTRKLVQEDKVFAIYNSLGTEHNLAIRPFLNALKVPQVFAATGATTFSADYKRYPWTIGYQPSYVAEGRIYGRAIGQLGRNKKVAVFYQNDDYGKELLSGVKQGLRFAGRGGRIVGEAELRDLRHRHQLADLAAEGLGRERDRDRRHAGARDPRLHRDQQARLAAAGDRELGRERVEHDEDRAGLERPGRERLDRDRLPQGPDRPALAQRQGRAPLPPDHVAVLPGL